MTDVREEWVGYYQLGDHVEFVKVIGPIGATGDVRLDVPNRRTFALPVATDRDDLGVSHAAPHSAMSSCGYPAP